MSRNGLDGGRFGWCLDGHHPACQTPSATGAGCACPCHDTPERAHTPGMVIERPDNVYCKADGQLWPCDTVRGKVETL